MPSLQGGICAVIKSGKADLGGLWDVRGDGSPPVGSRGEATVGDLNLIKKFYIFQNETQLLL